MAGTEQLYHYSNYLSREDVARAFSEGTAKGQLAQVVATHLQDSGAGFLSGTSDRERKNILIAVNRIFYTVTVAGFLSGTSDRERKNILIAVNRIFYTVTPRMVNSFLRALQGTTDVVKVGFQDVKHLLGCERTVEGPEDEARDEVGRALNALLRQNISWQR
jgi:hypothetical protein